MKGLKKSGSEGKITNGMGVYTMGRLSAGTFDAGTSLPSSLMIIFIASLVGTFFSMITGRQAKK